MSDLLTANLAVLIATSLALILFSGAAVAALAAKIRRLNRRVSKLEQAVVSSIMDEDNPAKQIQAELVLRTYEQILNASVYTDRDWAMKEARRLCGC